MTEFRNGVPVDPETDIPDGRYYTAREFAALHDVDEVRVRVWINRGQIPAEHFYGRIYIPENAVVKFRWPWKRA